jgi:hypothetical protein
MIDSTTPSSSSRPSLADAISQVRASGKADFLLASGQVAKLTPVKLLRNYEAILRMAGIEQTLGESIGLATGSEALQIADAQLSRYADVPAYWVLPLGELIKRAARQRTIPGDVLRRVADLKLIRDAVMHGETDTFGEKTRKAIRETYELLLKRSKHAPTHALRARIEAVTRAKADGYQAEEMLATLGTLYQAIEAEVEIRTAMKAAGIFKGPLPHVESIFELKRASDDHAKIFQRDNLAWKFRASALVRNHLVHGTIIVPSDRQAAVVHEAHRLLGQAIAELSLKQNGGTTATGEFRNSINL